jgi:choline dehydrogenase
LSEPSPGDTFDLLVVGAGSAGCTLATELSRTLHVGLVEDAAASVETVHVRRPADYVRCFGGANDWGWSTTPQPALHERRLKFPRGRGWGGSTRINASIWLPPLTADLQAIEAASGGRLSLAELRGALDAVTAAIDPEPPRWLSATTRRFLAAATELGWDAAPFLRMNHRGRRVTAADLMDQSTARARPGQERRAGLSKVTATALRLRFDRQRVIGLEAETSRGTELLRARRGVVLAAGAIGTPLLLQRSGIGARAMLRRHQIDVWLDRPAVGAGLQDHLVLPVVRPLAESVSKARVPDANSETDPLASLPPRWSPRQLARWKAVGSGPVTSNLAEAGCLVGGGCGQTQLFVTPTDYRRYPAPATQPAMTIGVVLARPRSAGYVGIAGMHAAAAPHIDPAYLSEAADWDRCEEALEMAETLFAQPALRRWVAAPSTPSDRNARRHRTLSHPRLQRLTRTAQSLYHPVGSCRLGDDRDAVVDGRFAVRGCEGLWICDASVLPKLPAANPNALITSLAQLAARKIATAANATQSK